MAQERRRKTKRRPRRRFPGLYKAISALLIAVAVAAACVIFFRVSHIVVQGNVRYSAQEIIDVAGVEAGDNLIAVRGGRINRELRVRLPYIQTVSVRRQFPDTLVITVTEGEAAAAIYSDGRWWLMARSGKLLEETEFPGDCPVVTGLTPLAPAVGTYLAAGEAEQRRVDDLRALLEALEENGLMDKLDSVDLSEDYEVTFRWDGRLTVKLNPTLEQGMSYWLRRLDAAISDPAVMPGRSYTVQITDGVHIRFIPD